MKATELRIQGMSCGHCVAAVQRALEGVSGVQVERVEVGKATVRAESDEQVRQAIEAIEDAGYEAEAAGTAA